MAGFWPRAEREWGRLSVMVTALAPPVPSAPDYRVAHAPTSLGASVLDS
jgi:hypothetical protein